MNENNHRSCITISGNFDVRFTEQGLELLPNGTGQSASPDGHDRYGCGGRSGSSSGGQRADVPVRNTTHRHPGGFISITKSDTIPATEHISINGEQFKVLFRFPVGSDGWVVRGYRRVGDGRFFDREEFGELVLEQRWKRNLEELRKQYEHSFKQQQLIIDELRKFK